MAASQNTKLGLKPGITFALDGCPDGWSLDEHFAVTDDSVSSVDVLLAFFASAATLTERLPALAERAYPAGALWIAWPRKAAGHISDLGDGVVRATILKLGLVDTKVAMIDENWSGLKVVWRVSNRTR
jgi:hypothetical protein